MKTFQMLLGSLVGITNFAFADTPSIIFENNFAASNVTHKFIPEHAYAVVYGAEADGVTPKYYYIAPYQSQRVYARVSGLRFPQNYGIQIFGGTASMSDSNQKIIASLSIYFSKFFNVACYSLYMSEQNFKTSKPHYSINVAFC